MQNTVINKDRLRKNRALLHWKADNKHQEPAQQQQQQQQQQQRW